jgi:hypothetical protein
MDETELKALGQEIRQWSQSTSLQKSIAPSTRLFRHHLTGFDEQTKDLIRGQGLSDGFSRSEPPARCSDGSVSDTSRLNFCNGIRADSLMTAAAGQVKRRRRKKDRSKDCETTACHSIIEGELSPYSQTMPIVDLG